MLAKIKFYTFISMLILTLQGCGIYSFTGGDTGSAKTLQINFFNNNASLVEPTLSQDFTVAMQDFFVRQTSLSLVKNNGDLVFEGEIVRYSIVPMTATSQYTAAQNRLTIEFNVRYVNRTDESKNFERKFSHFYDYDANTILQDNTLNEAFNVIFERVTQDIFNASVGSW